MKLERIYERRHWMTEVMNQNFLAEDKGLRVYAIKKGEDEDPLADGSEITFERAKRLCRELPEGTEVLEYFRYLRGRQGAPWKAVHDIIHIATYKVVPGGPMTLPEKIKLLNDATPNDIERIKEAVGSGYTVGADEGGRVWVRKDMRSRTKQALTNNGVTISALAERLGKIMQNTSAYLLGKCGTTNDTLEEILWLIEDEEQ